MEIHRLRRRVAKLEADLGQAGDPFQGLIFVSNVMQKVVERAPVSCRLPQGAAEFVAAHHSAGTLTLVIANTVRRAVEMGAQVVEAKGKFLIPGLWDMHVHMFNQVSRRPPNT